MSGLEPIFKNMQDTFMQHTCMHFCHNSNSLSDFFINLYAFQFKAAKCFNIHEKNEHSQGKISLVKFLFCFSLRDFVYCLVSLWDNAVVWLHARKND